MKGRMLAEAAFQIGLFLLIVTIGFMAGQLAQPLGPTWALIGSAVTATLTSALLFNWSRILERFWPRRAK